MATSPLLAFDPGAPTLALADGDEVLVHGGLDEAPRWRRTLEAPVVGVGAAGGVVATLDAQGTVTWWSAAGDPLTSSRLGGEPCGFALSPDGQACAVLFEERMVLMERGAAARSVPVGGARCAAFSCDGGRVAVGAAAGTLSVVGFAGDLVGQANLEGAVRSVAASPRGDWYLTAADRVLRVAPGGDVVHQVTRASGYEPDCITVSEDGALFAVRLDEALVLSLGDPPGETVVQLSYPERRVCGVAFGPGRVLGVGLHGGDANFVHIAEKELRRSDTFEGRTHNRWLVRVVIDPEAAPKATTSPSGAGRPLASVAAPMPAAAPTPAAPPPAPPAPAPASKARSIAIGVLSLVLLVGGVVWKVNYEERQAKEERDRAMKERIDKQVRESVRKSMAK